MFKRALLAVCCLAVFDDAMATEAIKSDTGQIGRRHSDTSLTRSEMQDLGVSDPRPATSPPALPSRVSLKDVSPSVPYKGKLAILTSKIAKKNDIKTFAVVNEETARGCIYTIYKEGVACLAAGDLKEAEYIQRLLSNPGDVFHFETSFEQGNFESREQYLSTEKGIYELSEEKSEELAKAIAEKEKETTEIPSE